ncbi:sulfur carrier protein ThiS [Secundilactobacillus kimchicus]|uniref:sulfur carrier protein ThiS n=1 Tax=Secundilactobacillus kimchicus TaxID=528209 RepID=UPI0024A81E34|nr:sulfur carrier protein ThiS [Secundilactobacillus kimchicus]
MVTVNGQQEVNVAGKSVAQFLSDRQSPIENIVVEVNGDIVHHSEFDTTILKTTDKVELISFVGGGR